VYRVSFHISPHDGSTAPPCRRLLVPLHRSTQKGPEVAKREAGPAPPCPPATPRYLSVLVVNHDVMRFDISVHDSHAMAVI